MRKLITLLLIAALLLPALALAEDPDPIVGPWYSYIDLIEYPELKSIYGEEIERIFMLYYFTEDNMILESDTAITGHEGSQTFSISGRWEKDETGYAISITGLGTNHSVIKDGCLMIGIGNFGNLSGYMRAYPITHFSPYTDYVYTQSY
jgi:hypothetical protein